MFERYTEKARRVIFFARYEASGFGSPYIETEHLLLGLFREEGMLLKRLLPEADYEAIRKQIAAGAVKISTSVDLPLSNESKRTLAYAAEEAERLGHRHIGSEHLLLGLLREQNCRAAQILHEHGAELGKLRDTLARPDQWISARRPEPPPFFRSTRYETVEIHGSHWDLGYVKAVAKECQRFLWQERNFAPRDIAVDRTSQKVSFDLSLLQDAANFELSKGGWKEDVCWICYWQFAESGDLQRTVGYTNGRDWLCSECYESFVSPGTKLGEAAG